MGLQKSHELTVLYYAQLKTSMQQATERVIIIQFDYKMESKTKTFSPSNLSLLKNLIWLKKTQTNTGLRTRTQKNI